MKGSVAGYFLIDLDTTYNVTKQLQVYATVKNLLDKLYANFAILGENFFDGSNHTFKNGATVNEQFRGVGAPRGVWVGMRYAWK